MAQTVLSLCDRFRCLPEPGGLLGQSGELLRLVRIEALARPAEPPEVAGGW